MPKIIRYTLSVYVERPIEEDDDPKSYQAPTVCRSLEREILACLRRLDGDTDCEVMESEIEEEK